MMIEYSFFIYLKQSPLPQSLPQKIIPPENIGGITDVRDYMSLKLD